MNPWKETERENTTRWVYVTIYYAPDDYESCHMSEEEYLKNINLLDKHKWYTVCQTNYEFEEEEQ